MEHISRDIKETASIAKSFARSLIPEGDQATIIGLSGELGSGKTTFMKYFAEAFGVAETIQSPTFVIEKIYELQNGPFTHLIHIDAYRIENESELVHLGWQEIIKDPKNLICIEWPERVRGLLSRHIMVVFDHISEHERKIEIKN